MGISESLGTEKALTAFAPLRSMASKMKEGNIPPP
jgi:hypothetical protein